MGRRGRKEHSHRYLCDLAHSLFLLRRDASSAPGERRRPQKGNKTGLPQQGPKGVGAGGVGDEAQGH